MKLEQQVCSLDLAKRLKELGVKQESLFYWENTVGQPDQTVWKVIPAERCNFIDQWLEYYSAFTLAELGEMLLAKYATQRIDAKTPYYICWCLDYEDADSYTTKQTDAMSEADARAKMLCYLLENKVKF